LKLPLRRLSTLFFALLALLALLALAPDGSAEAESPSSSASDRSAARPAADSLADLMASFAASRGVRARFIETRHLSILMTPIESAGMLYFEPPDRLARYTTRPGRASVVVNGGRVVMSDETGVQQLDLANSEIARDFVGNLIAILSGDLESLGARFEIEFEAAGEQWLIGLKPRSRTMQNIIEWVRFKGHGVELNEVETRATSGDTTVLIFSDIETGLTFGADERERIFRLERAGVER
jgi:outer membrane lipoprotein-sorting protein